MKVLTYFHHDTLLIFSDTVILQKWFIFPDGESKSQVTQWFISSEQEWFHLFARWSYSVTWMHTLTNKNRLNQCKFERHSKGKQDQREISDMHTQSSQSITHCWHYVNTFVCQKPFNHISWQSFCFVCFQLIFNNRIKPTLGTKQ